MLLEFEVKASARVCAESGQTLKPGEIYFSVLEAVDAQTVRHDYSADHWQGPPEANIGWWRSRVPAKDEKPKLAPAEVMLNLFASLAENADEQQFRYVLGLLLIRRRLLRREASTHNEAGQEVITVIAPKRGDEQYELVVSEPNPEQAEHIQQRMIDLLYGDGIGPSDSQSNSSTPEAA